MVGVISSMLNVFLHFLNTFLLCLFFLAGLIPQLLQKSRISYTGLPVYFIERPVSAASEGVASADAKPQARRAETEATGFRC